MAATAALATLMATNGLINAVGQRRAATAAEQQGDFQAGVLGINAELADRAAEDAVARGRETANRSQANTRQLRGAQRATLAAQGIDVGDGSAADLGLETEQLGELDVLTIANNAQREAFGFKVEAVNYRNQATLARYGARTTAASLRNASISTLLTTGAQLGELAYQHGVGQKGGKK